MENKKRVAKIWDDKELEKAKKLCSKADSWLDLRAFYEKEKEKISRTWEALRHKTMEHKDWTKHFTYKRELKEFNRKKFIDFLAQSRTKKEISKKFNLSEEKIEALLAEKDEGHRLITQFNVHNEKTFFLLPEDPEEIIVRPRNYSFRLQENGQPYMVVEIPESYEWRRVKIIPISDVVFGSFLHDAPLFDEYINWIARSPQVLAFFNGDIIAYQRDIESLVETMERFEHKISRIAHKILWAQQGDEERRSKRVHEGFDPLDVTCDDLGIPYFEEPVYADILWAKNIFSFYCFHGFTGAQTKGGKVNAALRPLDFQEHTMFIVMSHAQDSITKEKIRICRDTINFDLIEKGQHTIINPGFSQYFGSEKARKGYPPPSRGTVSCNLERNGEYSISA